MEALHHGIKQREQKKQSTNSFIAAAKKYTDLQELDATVLREFVDRIEISATEKWKKIQEQKISIVYNFIGAFDFEMATEQSKVKCEQKQEQ